MRILSLDLGEKSLGICVSDENNLIAIPVENYIFKRHNFYEPLDKIKSMIKKYNINTILLGYPIRTDGKKSDSTIMVEKFKELLDKNISNVEIKLVNEQFSTQRGIELLKSKYKNKKDILKYKDMAAAYIILLDYLIFKES